MKNETFDAKKAAEFFVVAWCKDWPLGTYLRAIGVGDRGERDWGEWIAEINGLYPWMPVVGWHYRHGARAFVGAAYPKLSAWLLSRKTNIDRLKCAPQIEKLKPPAHKLAMVQDSDRAEMKSASKDERQASASYKLSRASFKTHQRSAWNVCK